MQHILGLTRRCVEDYHMIAPGDRIAVGVSGGKDSLLTLAALARLRHFYPVPFTVEAITLEMGMPGMDYGAVADYCAALEVPYTRISVPVYEILFEERREKNPCSLCAKLRRGSLNTALTQRGIRKIALGHHYDDAIETLLMNLLFEGRIGCFQPVTYLDRTGITQIRPLLYCREEEIRRVAAREHLPVVENSCPMDGASRRQEVKELIASLEGRYPDLKKKLFGAVQRYPLYGWSLEREER
jgi:tRNA(Ile)-lysidine synthase TilS/MesJ